MFFLADVNKDRLSDLQKLQKDARDILTVDMHADLRLHMLDHCCFVQLLVERCGNFFLLTIANSRRDNTLRNNHLKINLPVPRCDIIEKN